MSTTAPTAGQITARIAASLLGGYAFTWGFAALGVAALATAGMGFEDAYTLTMLLAFLVFLTVFCWAFAARSLGRVWGVLVGGGALMTATSWALSRSLA